MSPYVGKFLTPDEDIQADSVFYRLEHNVPVEWQSIIDGLFESASDAKYWQKFGALDPEHCALVMQELHVRWFIMDVCEKIADCIENSDAVRSALENFIRDNGAGGDYGAGVGAPTGSGSDANLLDGVSCDNDTLFNVATELTDRIHENIMDLLDDVELKTNVFEISAIVADHFPVAGAVPEMIDFLFEQAVDQYNAGWDAQLRDDIRCDIFCMMEDDCSFSVSEFLSYVVSNSSLVITPTSTLREVMVALSSVLDPVETVWGLWSLVLLTNVVGAKFGWLLGETAIEQIVELAKDGSDPDWAILCDCSTPSDPCAMPIDITFADAPYTCLTGIQGSIESGYGNPDPCFRRRNTGNSQTIAAIVEISVPAGHTTLNYSYDFWHYKSGAFNGSTEIIAYDEFDNALASANLVAQNGDYSISTWTTTSGSLDGAGTDIRKVRVSVGTTLGATQHTVEGRLDNIQLTS